MRRTLRTSRQVRCSGIFSAVQRATPLSPVSGLLCVILALLPSLCSGMVCPVPSPAAVGNVLLFPQMKHFRHFLPVRQTLFVLLDSDCCAIQASGPHRTPALLPTFLPVPPGPYSLLAKHSLSSHGHGSEGAISETLASFNEEVVGKIPHRWVVVHILVSWTQLRSISAGHSIWLFQGFVCTCLFCLILLDEKLRLYHHSEFYLVY